MIVPPHARCWLEVDASALAHNAAHVQERAGVPLTAVVKANGYGLGAAEVARAALAGGAASVAVATAAEAQSLRAAGITAPIQILGALLPGEIELAAAAEAAITLHEPADLLRVRESSLRVGRPLDVHLAVDVGMRRHGVAPEDALGVLGAAQRDPALRIVGVMTHLPNAAGPDLELTRARVASFAQVVAQAEEAGCCPAQVHAAASAAVFRLPEAHFNHVRAGIALLGLDPADCLGPTELRPALSLRARVTRTNEVRAGQPVGYGGRWVPERDSRVALLGIGYGDGLPYGWTQGGAEVLIAGQRCPLVGSVMMDYVFVDVSDLPRPPQPGEVATLVGRDGAEELRLEPQAARAGLIPYALTCGLGGRLERVLVGAEQASVRLAA